MSNTYTKGQGGQIGIKFTEELVSNPAEVFSWVYKTPNVASKTASNLYSSSYPLNNLFDGSTSSYARFTSTVPQTLLIQLYFPVCITGFQWYIGSSTYYPKAFYIEGSNDGTTFTTLGTFAGASTVGWQAFTFTNTVAYQYYRITTTSMNSSYFLIYELQFFMPIGNESAFTVSGKQYKYVNGDLLDATYTVGKVEPHPTEPNAILLTFDVLSRFPTVEGDLSVSYDSSKGNLSGAGGAVESFTQVFTPLDLIPEPNPGITESITVSPEIVVEFIEVEYPKVNIGTETLTGSPLEPIVSYDYNYAVRKCWMEAPTQLVKFDSGGQLLTESQNIILTIINKNCTAPVYTFKLVIDSVEYDGYTTLSTDKTQLTVNMASVIANFPSLTQATVKMTMVDTDLTIEDYITLYKVQDGSTDVVALLTNEYHDVVALYNSTTGLETEQKLNQAWCDIRVYQGFNDITSEYTFTKTDTGLKSLFYTNRNQIQILNLVELSGQVQIIGTHSTLPTVNKIMTLKKDQRGLIVKP
jgi:hypothetical protein